MFYTYQLFPLNLLYSVFRLVIGSRPFPYRVALPYH